MVLSPENNATFKIVTWSISMVFGLAAINSFIIVSNVGTNLNPFEREVASVAPAPIFNKELISPTIEYDCKNKKKKYEITTKAPTIRVQFKGCKSVGRVTNSSNKNQGDVFFLPNEDWTSDFIFLSHGKNALSIPVDSKIHTINVIRAKAKTNSPQKAL
ncbi:MAG: hypothetical protein HRT44_03310 [Bdellovibrionales bacterium]|nr:hypothetical protein [Bdellovibrionales bacterium]NQZ18275.1 hypothetical protein [Bdellovibrionales bacterium]